MSDLHRITERYRLDKLIHASDTASVFRATDPRSGQTVALKLIRNQPGGTEPEQRTALENASRVLQGCTHAALPHLLDFGFTAAGAAFLVTDYLPGASFDLLAGSSAARVLPLLLPVLEALEELDRHQLAHRNLRSDNLLLVARETPGGTPGGESTESIKLLGWGHAALGGGEDGRRADLKAFAELICAMVGAKIRREPQVVVSLPAAAGDQIADESELAILLSLLLQPGGPAPASLYSELRRAFSQACFGDATEPAAPTGPAPTIREAVDLDETRALLADVTMAVPRDRLPGSLDAGAVRADTLPSFRPADLALPAAAAAVLPFPLSPRPTHPARAIAADTAGTPDTPFHPDTPDPALTPHQAMDSAALEPSEGTTWNTAAAPPSDPPSSPLPPPAAALEPRPGRRRAGGRRRLIAGAVASLLVVVAVVVTALHQLLAGGTRPATPPHPTPAAGIRTPSAAAVPPRSSAAAVLPAGTAGTTGPAGSGLVAVQAPRLPAMAAATTSPGAAAVPPQPSLDPRLRQAAALLAGGDAVAARRAVAEITAEQRATFGAADRQSFDQLTTALGEARRAQIAGDLAAGLRRGDIRRLNAALTAAKRQPDLFLPPGLRRDLERARQALDLDTRLYQLEKAQNPQEVLRTASGLLAVLPRYSRASELREQAAKTIEEQADAAFAAGDTDRGAALATGLRQLWPDRTGLEVRLARLEGQRRADERLEGALASAARAEAANQPLQGLELLAAVKPSERFRERFRQQRDRINQLLAKLDAAPPSIALRPGYKLEYGKGEPIALPLRITDDLAVKTAECWVRPEGAGSYQAVPVRHLSGADYEADIPPELHQNRPLEVYAVASDTSGHQSMLGSRDKPLKLKRRNWIEKIFTGKEGS